jgi:hypothetical protein
MKHGHSQKMTTDRPTRAAPDAGAALTHRVGRG